MPRLRVYYDVGDWEGVALQDARADEAAGRASASTGANMFADVRDLDYAFDSEEELKAAKERLRDAGFRFFP